MGAFEPMYYREMFRLMFNSYTRMSNRAKGLNKKQNEIAAWPNHILNWRETSCRHPQRVRKWWDKYKLQIQHLHPSQVWWFLRTFANIHWTTKKVREFQKNICCCSIDYEQAFDCVHHKNCGKFFKRWITDHLTCFLRNLYAGQEATVRTGHGTTDWFQIGKGVHQGCILSPCLFNLYAEYIMRNAGLEEAQAGIKNAGRNINKLRYADDTTLNGRKWRRTKEPLDESERGEWNGWLKIQHSEN